MHFSCSHARCIPHPAHPITGVTPYTAHRFVPILYNFLAYEGVSKIFQTGRLEWEPQMVQLSATGCSCIVILWVSLVSFAAITPCVASQRVFVCCCLFRHRLSPETFGYTLVQTGGLQCVCCGTPLPSPFRVTCVAYFCTDGYVCVSWPVAFELGVAEQNKTHSVVASDWHNSSAPPKGWILKCDSQYKPL
jgi:hypothetical protein